MEDTYTFIARSAHNPDKVATFTLHDDTMSVDIGSPLEYLERALQTSEEDEPEAQNNGQGELALPWLKPTAVRLLQRVTRPFSVSDIDASSAGNGLYVRAWVRVGGLRLAPVVLAWDEVDNPDATRAFIAELNQRRQATAHPGRFRGVLDYWASWLVAGLVFGFLLFQQFRKEKE
jgi:hypothetical protein